MSDDEISKVCEQFEAALRNGEQPPIERFLFTAAGPDRLTLFRELLGLEIEFRQDAGENPQPEEYFQRFSPEFYAIILEELFSTTRPIAPRTVGDYELVREIGRGGMGVVYEARDRSLGKRVALKLLPASHALDTRGRKRFKNEARAAAQLEHPHIVPVYSDGEQDGILFYVMQFIEGRDLSRFMRSIRPTGDSTRALSTPDNDELVVAERSSAEVVDKSADTKKRTLESTQRTNSTAEYLRYIAGLVRDVADALQHAHEMGIVHRDIKPSNLILDVNDHIWVTDFGLAQMQGEPGVTFTGDLVGTWRYMSPEQAYGSKRVVLDQRTDIYSLGITLYELLTLRPAFDADSREKIVWQIAFHYPKSPRKINRSIPEELETIVEKAIEKRPDDRYQTAGEMADDLRRFLQDLPILAKPPSLQRKIRKWARRHRATVMFAAALWLVLSLTAVGFAILTSIQARQLQASLTETQAQELVARSRFELDRDPAKSLLLASMAAQVHESPTARSALISAIAALQERRLLAHDHRVGTCRYSADGRLLVTTAGRVGGIGTHPFRIWNADTGTQVASIQTETPPTSAVFSPDGRSVLVGFSPYAAETSTGEEIADVGISPSLWSSEQDGSWPQAPHVVFADSFLLDAHSRMFHPDGKLIVLPAKGSRARVYRVDDGQVDRNLPHPGMRVIYAAYRSNGAQIVTLAEDAAHKPVAYVWDAAEEPIAEIDLGGDGTGQSNEVSTVEFHPNDDVLLIASADRGVELWDYRARQRLNTGYWTGSVAHFDGSGSKVVCVTTYGDRREIGDEIDVRDAQTGYTLAALGVPGGTEASTVSADGSKLAVIAGDMTARVWDLTSFKLLAEMRGHTGVPTDLDLRLDGSRLTTSSSDQTARIWNVASHGEQLTVPTIDTIRGPLADASGDSSQFFAATPPEPRFAFWDLQSLHSTEAIAGGISAPGMGNSMYLTASNGRVDAWDSQTGMRINSIHVPGIDASLLTGHFAVAENTGWAAIAFAGNSLLLWNPREKTHHFLLPAHRSSITTLAFSPDGKSLASGSVDGWLRMWSVEERKLQRELPHEAPLIDIDFSPQGERIVTTTSRDQVFIRSVDDFQLITRLPVGNVPVKSARFSFDGKYIITFQPFEADVAAWEAETGVQVNAFQELAGFSTMALSDQDHLVAVAAQGNDAGQKAGARLWNYVTRAIVTLPSDQPIQGIAFWPAQPRILGITQGHLDDRSKYGSDQSLAREGSSRLLCWDFAGDPIELPGFPLELHQDARLVKVVENPPRLCARYSEYGFAAYSSANLHQYTALAHAGQLSDMEFVAAPQSRVITAGYDGKVVEWNRQTGQAADSVELAVAVFDVHSNPAAPHEIAVAAADGTVQIWNTTTGEVKSILNADSNFSQAWQVEFAVTGSYLLTVHRDNAVVISNLATGGHKVLRSSDHSFNRGEFSADGTRVLAVEGLQYTNGNDDEKPPFLVQVFDTAAAGSEPLAALPHPAPVWFATFDPQGETVLTITTSGECSVWQLAEKRKLRTFGSVGQRARYAEFSPTGDLIYVEFRDYTSAAGYVNLYRTADGELHTEIPIPRSRDNEVLFPWGGRARAFTRDGTWMLLPIDVDQLLRIPTAPAVYARQLQPRSFTEVELEKIRRSQPTNN